MLNDVNVNVTDGLLKLSELKGDGVHVKIGASPVTSGTPILITGDMTPANIRALLGYCPLADKVIDSVENGANVIYCIPVAATTAGTAGTVTSVKTGTGTLTVSGSPNNAFSVIIKVTGTGQRNTATFKYSIDGGYSYSGDKTVPVNGAYAIPYTGLTATFAEGSAPNEATSFVAADTFSFTTTAPAMTNGDATAAIAKLKYFNTEFEFVHIVGESEKAFWVAVSAARDELATDFHKPLLFVVEAFAPTTNETASAYAARLITAKDVFDYDLQVVAARALYTGLDGITRNTNLAGVVCGMYARTPVQQSIGKTRDSANMDISNAKILDLLPDGIEEFVEDIDGANFLTFRQYIGLPNVYYVTNARVMAPADTDYLYAEDTRVKNKIAREVRKEGLQLLQDDINLDDLANELAKRVIFMREPLDQMIKAKEISSASITAANTQDIATTGKLSVIVRYKSRGYIRDIEVDLGRSK